MLDLIARCATGGSVQGLLATIAGGVPVCGQEHGLWNQTDLGATPGARTGQLVTEGCLAS